MGIFKKNEDKKAVKPKKESAEKVNKKEAKPAKAKKTKESEVQTYKSTGNAYQVLIKPLYSEKSGNLEQNYNKYSFIVNSKATKPEIKKAVKKVYNVDVVKVNIINVKPTAVRFRGRKGTQKAFSKAIVTLKKEQSIDYFKPVYK